MYFSIKVVLLRFLFLNVDKHTQALCVGCCFASVVKRSVFFYLVLPKLIILKFRC
jgi:hypothetical protein